MSKGHNRPTTRGTLFNSKKDEDKSKDYQVQNVKKSRVYVFGDADIQEDEIVEFEMSEVRSRKAPKQIEPEENESLYFDREVAEGDTLQSISLQYGCPVGEIKRINNMMQDQDFFARRSIKVPIKRHSFLTEVIAQNENDKRKAKQRSNGATLVEREDEESEHEGTSTDQAFNDTDNESNCDFSDPETQRLIIRTLSINDAFHSQSHEAKKFLKSMDKDLSNIRSSTRLNRSSLSEVVSVLTDRTIRPMQSRKTKLNWTDCGVTSKSIITFTVIAFIVLFVIFLYYRFFTSDSSKELHDAP